jgi:hypothetical protein
MGSTIVLVQRSRLEMMKTRKFSPLNPPVYITVALQCHVAFDACERRGNAELSQPHFQLPDDRMIIDFSQSK